ncbi:MAG: hypothetical protein SF028_12045 [Candidatus Sumerlaeia bacterium]|nr:hypothetical protein [Candidatus Sumerlaeia bacterium]
MPHAARAQTTITTDRVLTFGSLNDQFAFPILPYGGGSDVIFGGSYYGNFTLPRTGGGSFTLQHQGNGDVFFARMDIDTNAVDWVFTARGPQIQEAPELGALPDGTILASLGVSGATTIGAETTTPYSLSSVDGSFDPVLLAVEPGGLGFEWTEWISGPLTSLCREFAPGRGLDFFACVWGRGSLTFRTGQPDQFTHPETNKFFDGTIAKYRGDGSLAWVTANCGEREDFYSAVSRFADGHIVTVGKFSGTSKLACGRPSEATLTGAGDFDILTAEFDGDGELVWALAHGGTLGDDAFHVEALPSGDFLFAGNYSNGAGFQMADGSTRVLNTVGSATDTFIAKARRGDGRLLWVSALNSEGANYAQDLVYLPDAGLAATVSSFENTLSYLGFPFLESRGGSDMVVALFRVSDGGAIAAHQIGGTGNETASHLKLMNDGRLVLAGSFEGICIFGPPDATARTSNGGADGFLMTMRVETDLARRGEGLLVR